MKLNSSEKQILELISLGQGLSRKKIAETLHLTQGSITNMTRSLLEEGLIIEGNRISSGLGRKEVMLYSNPNKFTFLGVDIGGHVIRFALATNSLEIIHEGECLMADLATEPDPAEVLMQMMHTFLAQWNISPAQIDAIGIGVTGIIDATQQILLSIPNSPGWEHLELVSIISQRFNCPVYLEEGGRTMAIAEQMLGKANAISDFITVQVGFGIAAGIMINGKLLKGVNNTAGLLGHITADPNGTRCLCGNYGCLENIITFPMLRNDYRKITGKSTIVEAYQQNDKQAIDVCVAAGQALGIALSNVVNLFNPQTIYIGGAMFDQMPILLEETKRTIILRGNRFSTTSLNLDRPTFGLKQGIMGALALAKISHIMAQ
ncbi:ROK family transcriptional regulator [Paenibacillus eucommiae]|uniref:N-acetylglucosamine repressor n=1 Tax=Paenibacillus eucommiae TaxID=1355755 RepID=A0ABS4J443_9BACL|nr:ROK family protein [Paenibacillus eucommiae]MBP1994614.1 N-acetylglucosamine repressor [Paenibacillus eucommiae]